MVALLAQPEPKTLQQRNDTKARHLRDILIEGEIASLEEWKERLQCGRAEFDKLRSLGALRLSSGQKSNLRLDFVGLLTLRENTFFAAPKLFGQEGKKLTELDVSRSVRCIQRYQSRLNNGATRAHSADEAFFEEAGSRLSLFLQLLAWTRDHGLHKEDLTSLFEDMNHIDWGDTLACGMTLHMRTGPVFSEYHSRREIGQPGELAVIQSKALLSLHEELGIVGHLWLSRHDPLFDVCRQHLEESVLFGTMPDISKTSLFEADLKATKDHDRELVELLKSWFESSPKGSQSLSLYGLNAFHVVWEDMCAVALGPQGKSQHSLLASQPVHDIGHAKIALSSQRPDYLFNDANGILVADAKWYRSWRNEFPQLPDVVKQLVYGMSLDASKKVQANLFILPTADTGQAVSHLGTTSMLQGGKIDPRFPCIQIIGVDWDLLADAYISNVAISNFRSQIVSSAQI
jgi:hypothetical protein